MRIGEVLKDWRTMQRLTIREASKMIGVPISTLSRIENGMTMDGKCLAKILRWLTTEIA